MSNSGTKLQSFPPVRAQLSESLRAGAEQVFLKRTEVEQALGSFMEVKVVELQQPSLNNLNSIYGATEDEAWLW